MGANYIKGMVELQMRRKGQNNLLEEDKLKGKCAFMEVECLFAALAYWCMLLDKEGAYVRRSNQHFWERVFVIMGDMGADSTKLCVFDSHD